MPLRRRACRRQRQHLRFVVQHHRIKMSIDPRQDCSISLLGVLPEHPGKSHCLGIIYPRPQKARPHMVSNPRLTRRSHLPVRKLRHIHSGLHTGHGLQAQQLTGPKKLIDSVQHVEVHQASYSQPCPPRSPGYMARRISQVVVRIERMVMCIDVLRPFRQFYRSLPDKFDQPLQSLTPPVRIETVKFFLQLSNPCIHRHILACLRGS